MKGYFTTPAVKRNKYNSTSLDVQKNNADILVQSIDDRYTIWSNVELKVSRSIKHVSGKLYEVTEKAMEQLQSTFNVMYDL